MIKEYFKVDSKELRSQLAYFPENQTYEYRPRGFHDCEYHERPYPEVVAYVENDDGTLTLTVNAVYPAGNTSKAITHEVVVRPLENGCFQYVSNQVIAFEEYCETKWHTDRLTREEWEDIYERN